MSDDEQFQPGDIVEWDIMISPRKERGVVTRVSPRRIYVKTIERQQNGECWFDSHEFHRLTFIERSRK